jgi:hypothetical protein
MGGGGTRGVELNGGKSGRPTPGNRPIVPRLQLTNSEFKIILTN